MLTFNIHGTDMAGEPSAHEDHGDHSSSPADDSTEEEPIVESLVAGREKRATAGAQMSSLLEKEGDDDLELLFAEDEDDEDVEFEDEDEEGSDAQLESSTDEEDQDPVKGDDDLAGEKELQKQARIERQKKRKFQDVLRPAALRKKLKSDPIVSPSIPMARPKKKSERVSWVHTEADAPTRASSRKQTVQNREIVHQRLIDNEQTRLKVMQQMEEAQKRKNAMKPKTSTQADRLEEAAKIERKNAKSLNRWEESEKKRCEEQKAKLEALHNRQLSGPVVTWWSGISRWVNGKIGQLGVREIRGEGFTEKNTQPDDSKMRSTIDKPQERLSMDNLHPDTTQPEVVHPHVLVEPSEQLRIPEIRPYSAHQQITFPSPLGPYGFLDGIHAYAALPMQQHQAEFTGTADGDSEPISYSAPITSQQSRPRAPDTPPQRFSAKEIEFASRTLVALKNIDANAMRLPELQNSVLVKKRTPKPQKPTAETCAITMQPARFRDPKTGLSYANSYAYKEIQRLRNGGSRWSDLLDCYVGPVHKPARGVPQRFWRGP